MDHKITIVEVTFIYLFISSKNTTYMNYKQNCRIEKKYSTSLFLFIHTFYYNKTK